MAGTNIYLMSYKNQLIHTGQINSTGAPIMTNVDKSSRTGVEFMAGIKFLRKFNWNLNVTISSNKIENFTEYVEDWDNSGLKANTIGKSDLAFSPDLIANSILAYRLCSNFEISLLSNYVGKQYIDNTSSNDRKLKAYLVNNLKFDYTPDQKIFKELKFKLLINNLFNKQYESNAWVYSYLYQGRRNKMDGYFPQAGANFMFSVSVGF